MFLYPFLFYLSYSFDKIAAKLGQPTRLPIDEILS